MIDCRHVNLVRAAMPTVVHVNARADFGLEVDDQWSVSYHQELRAIYVQSHLFAIASEA